MNTKKISELNITENVSEGMNVVVEDNGQTKRFPASKIVTSVNGKTGDVELIPGVQSDWNENDSSSLAFVKNRPFYDGVPVETEIIPETTVTFSNSNNVMLAYWPENFIPTKGETYLVSWDGTEYTCVCSMLESIPYFGNVSMADNQLEDTGEPFIFMYQGRCVVGSLDTSAEEHTIGIKQSVAQINQIDKKYIPNSAFTDAEWDRISNKIVDYKQVNSSLSVIDKRINVYPGTSYSQDAINTTLIFENKKVYGISGTARFTNTTSKLTHTCNIDVASTVSNYNIFLGSFYDKFTKETVKVYLYSSNSPLYTGKLSFTSGVSGYTYTFSLDITVHEEATVLPDMCLSNSIARKDYVDSLLPSFSEDDYKKTLVINSTGDLEVANYSWNDLSDKPFSKTTSVKEIVSATGTVSSGGGLDINSENPGFTSGVEYTVNINGTEEAIIAAYSNLSGYVQLTGSNFSIYPTSRGYDFLSSAYSNTEVTISISGPVEEIVTIDPDFIPESIARKEHVDSILPNYTQNDNKGTFVVNSQGQLEVQRYNWDYLTNKPFGKLDGYEPVAVLNLTTTGKTFTIDSGSMNNLSNNRKYWVVSSSSTGKVSWLASYSVASSYNIYYLTINTSNYPDAIFSKFDFGTNTYTTNGNPNVIPSVVSIYNENEWGTKMMDEAYIPDSIQRVGGDVIIPSSTANSTKKFKITVDDSGTISATEVT